MKNLNDKKGRKRISLIKTKIKSNKKCSPIWYIFYTVLAAFLFIIVGAILSILLVELKNKDKVLINFLSIVKQHNEWIFLNSYYNDFKITDYNNDNICFGKQGAKMIKCISKESDIRQFIECSDNKCSVYGKIHDYGSEFIYHVDDIKFITQKLSQNEFTVITIHSPDKSKLLGKITIYGQGNDLAEATSIDILNYDGILQIENLILIAARNIFTYEKKRTGRMIVSQIGQVIGENNIEKIVVHTLQYLFRKFFYGN